jgi:hypothetical protein
MLRKRILPTFIRGIESSISACKFSRASIAQTAATSQGLLQTACLVALASVGAPGDALKAHLPINLHSAI